MEQTDLVPTDTAWKKEHESILIDWADKAMCYRWLHGKANSSFSRKNTWYTIPVIIISTLTGTANFAQDRVPVEYQGYFVMTVGAFNILAGIILPYATTIITSGLFFFMKLISSSVSSFSGHLSSILFFFENS